MCVRVELCVSCVKCWTSGQLCEKLVVGGRYVRV